MKPITSLKLTLSFLDAIIRQPPLDEERLDPLDEEGPQGPLGISAQDVGQGGPYAPGDESAHGAEKQGRQKHHAVAEVHVAVRLGDGDADDHGGYGNKCDEKRQKRKVTNFHSSLPWATFCFHVIECLFKSWEGSVLSQGRDDLEYPG